MSTKSGFQMMLRRYLNPFFLVSCLAWLVVCLTVAGRCESGHRPAQLVVASNDTTADQADRFTKALDGWTAAARQFATDENDFGLFPTSTQAPSIGRLLAFVVQDGIEKLVWSCSGAAISPNKFLSAAHCFCRDSATGVYFADQRSCVGSATFQKTKYRIFFPNSGLFDTEGTPSIHPEYKSPAGGFSPHVSALADLGVIQFDAQAEAKSVFVASFNGAKRFLLASFGLLSFKAGIEGRGFKSNTAYQEGVATLSGQQAPLDDQGSCPEAGADTLCIWYSSLAARSGPKQTVGLCPADSGSPLLAVGEDGEIGIVGVASYFWPASSETCDASSDRRSYFINLSKYRDWLQDQAGPPSQHPKRDNSCTDVIFRGVQSVSTTRAVVTLTVFDEYRPGRPRPRARVTAEQPPSCKQMEDAGVLACIGKGTLRIQIDEGFGQLTLCRME